MTYRIGILWIFILFLFSAENLKSQLNVDSLKQSCNLSNDPSLAFSKIQDTIFYLFNNDIHKAKRLLPYLKHYSRILNTNNYWGVYYQYKGYYNNYISELDSSIYYLQKSLNYFKKDTSANGGYRTVFIYNAIALIYDDAGLYKTSIQNHLYAIRISEDLKKKFPDNKSITEFLAEAYSDIAQTYSNVEDSELTNLYFKKSIAYAKEKKLQEVTAINQFNYAVYLFDISDYDKAYTLFEESKDILIRTDIYNLLVVNLNEAKILLQRKQFDKALSLCDKSIKIASEHGYEQLKSSAYLVKSNICQIRGDLDMALVYANKYRSLCKELELPRLVKSAEANLVDLYELKSNYIEAFKHQKSYLSILDILNKEDLTEKINSLTLKYNLEKQASENKRLSIENRMNEMEIKTKTLNNTILSISTLILFIILVFMWLYYKKSRKTNSKLAELNNELMQKKNALNEANSVQKNLFAIISHDLKGPIGTAKSFFDILNNEEVEISQEDRNNYVKLIGRSISSTYDLLENILFWSKNRMTDAKDEVEEFYPFAIVNEILSNISSTLFTKEITFRNRIDSNIVINSDLSIFKVVIRNLLTNAIKFTPRQGEISVSLEEENENYWVKVKDNGIGIQPEILSSLFNPSSKESIAGTENEKGTGLGLMISNELIEQLGGKFHVESQVGKGSTFSFSIKKQT